jgi:ribokinase
MENNKQIDFLAIGDIVTDVFIKIKDAEVTCDIDHAHCKLCVRFGEKIPFESAEEIRAVGNSANAAVSASKLGLTSALLANVGNDTHGHACIEELKKNNVDTTYVGIHDGFATNYHYVLWYGVERTILVNHEHFPTKLPNFATPPKMIYLTSLGEGTNAYHDEIISYVENTPSIKLVFQPGTFQINMGTEKLARIYKSTYLFFCNVEEAQKILNKPNGKIKELIAGLHTLGAKLVCITDGPKGAYGSDGTTTWFMPIYPQEPIERTGAGDAFASTVSSALLLGKSFEEALSWGPINSMSVVQEVGAQRGLLTKEKLEDYLAKAPEDYKISII